MRLRPARRRLALRAASALALAAAARGTARAQAVIKVNDSTSIRFGVLLQPWFDESRDPVTNNYAQNIFLRRARVLVGGQINSKFGFFLETDNPNLGRAQGAAGKQIAGGFILQDAYVDYKPAAQFTVQAGLMLPPSARNALETAAGLLPIDFSSYAFTNGAVTLENEVGGRDLGVQARGYLFKNRLEYRAGVFQGARTTPTATQAAAGAIGSTNALRGAGRLQLALLDPEVVPFFYPGVYFGRRKILNVGVSYDEQSSLRQLAGDVFFDYPVYTTGAVTLQADVFRRDGGRKFPALPRQTNSYVEGGFYFRETRLLPFGRFELQTVDGNRQAGQHRFQAGLGYFVSGQNLNLKAAYGQVRPNNARNTGQFTTQLQFFYY